MEKCRCGYAAFGLATALKDARRLAEMAKERQVSELIVSTMIGASDAIARHVWDECGVDLAPVYEELEKARAALAKSPPDYDEAVKALDRAHKAADSALTKCLGT